MERHTQHTLYTHTNTNSVLSLPISLVLSDMGAMERHLNEVYSAQLECPAMADAVALLRVWARQRGLDQVCGVCVCVCVVCDK